MRHLQPVRKYGLTRVSEDLEYLQHKIVQLLVKYPSRDITKKHSTQHSSTNTTDPLLIKKVLSICHMFTTVVTR